MTIMDGDDVLGSTVVDPDGNWTFTPEQDLADGDQPDRDFQRPGRNE
ncbi:hypothetical protein KIF59_23035 [Enterobacter cloacae subsp. cloacae]|nr:hypothetical protein [Enterobacter cloacae subsp. cloacae]